MTETFTLAHFTDVHLPPIVGFDPRYWNVKRALGFLNWQRGRRSVHTREMANRLIDDAKALRPDHIAITGDLVNLGLPGEHVAALNWLQSVGTPDSVTVVPGNHDVYSNIHGDEGIARWAAYMGGDADTHAFPFVRRLGPIALVGLNSAVETPPFFASGKLGPDQIEVAGDLLDRLADDGAIRVVLIHHPPFDGMTTVRRSLKDAKLFKRMLEKSGAELLLYGHNHTPHMMWLPTETGPVAVIAGGSASAARRHKNEALASYNLFTFFKSNQGLRIRHVRRGLETPDGPVVKLFETVLNSEP